MSEPRTTSPGEPPVAGPRAAGGPDPSGRPGRYQRSTGGLTGALIISVIGVVVFVGLRSLNSENEATPVRTVDYTAMAQAGRGQDQLLVLTPDRMPVGWRATSASYDAGAVPTWHLGLLTDDDAYVGVEESPEGIDDLVEEHVDEDAERGPDVTLAGATWQSFTDAGGDYALARRTEGPGGEQTVLVVGSAPDAEVRDLAERLRAPSAP